MTTFVGDEAVDWPDLEALVGGSTRLEVGAAQGADRTYLDTHDWRLFRAGTVLEIDRVGDARTLRWRRLGGGEVLLEQPIDAAPRFAWDIRAGGARRRLAAVSGVRALLPVAKRRGRCRPARVLDRREKTVARLAEWRWSGRRAARPTLLEVHPVRGYPRAAARVEAAAGGADGFAPSCDDPMLAASGAAGARPGERPRAPAPVLQPGMRADEGFRRLLGWLVEVMEENRPGTVADLDSEFLHDFRVALRKTRVLLGQSRDVLPARRVAALRDGYAWLGRLTGPLRDLDVHLLDLVADERRDAAVREDLAPLVAHLEARKAAMQPELAAALGSRRYRDLVSGVRRFAAQPPPRRPVAAAAAVPVGEVAARRIWHLYRRSLSAGRAIGADSAPESLHELRKTCKKLRYMLELFGSAFPDRAVRGTVRHLKKLQDHLGAFQDRCVQAGALARFRAEMSEAGTLTPAADAAIAALEADAARHAASVRSEFLDRFGAYDRKSNRKAARHLFGPGRAGGAR